MHDYRTRINSLLVSLLLLTCWPLIALGGSLDTGQLGYYLFSGDASDISGNNHHGTVTEADLVADRFGNPDAAYRFNGLDQRIDLGFGPGASYTSLSTNIWVRSLGENSGFGGHDENAFGQTWEGGNFICVYEEETSSYAEVFRISGYGPDNPGVGALQPEVGEQYWQSPERYDDGNWHMLTLTWDGNTASFYVDAVLAQEWAAPVVIEPDFNWFVGCRQTSEGSWPGSPFSEHAEGDIDDVGIWDRALTQAEVVELLTYVPQPELLAAYSFSGNADDESGQEHHGAVSGAQLTTDRFGSPEAAYRFNGLDQRIDLGFGPGENYTSLSTNIWVRSLGENSGFGGHDENAFGQTWEGGNFICVYDEETTSYAEVFRIYGYGPENSGVGALQPEVGQQYWLSPERYDDGNWHMLTLTWDGDAARLYVDTALQHEFSAPASIEPDFNWFVGCRQTSEGSWPGSPYSEHAEGDIDDVTIWSRELNQAEIDSLYDNFVQADFALTQTLVEVQESVAFTNQSTGNILGYDWDFGDGQVSSEESPVHVYTSGGDYTVTLTVHGVERDFVVSRDLTVIGEEPRILAIQDVPEDQGGRVYLRFMRSAHDDDGLSVKSLESYSVERRDGEQWVNLVSGNAYNQDEYVFEVATLQDSTAAASGLTEFRVIAGMSEGNWASTPVAGYSVDNIAPSAPAAVDWVAENTLEWQPVTDADFSFYRVYGANSGNLEEHGEEIATTVQTTLVLDEAVPVYARYYVVAVDDAGLESEAAAWAICSAAPGDLVPADLVLHGNFPNPFNPITTIRYSLPQAARVDLSIYDVQGRRIATLVAENQAEGAHEVVWQGRDGHGQQVSSGMYFARLISGGKVLTDRLLLLK